MTCNLLANIGGGQVEFKKSQLEFGDDGIKKF